MGKILGSWSAMKKYLEHEMLAPCLYGKVRYECSSYVGMDGCKEFRLYIDGAEFKRFSIETVNTWFINSGVKGKNEEHWKDFWLLLSQYDVNSRSEYTEDEFCEALEVYRNQNIQISVRSNNPLVQMFALLDRRVGTRTLNSMKESLMTLPQWLQVLYFFRVQSHKA